MLWAAFCVGFLGFIREGEFTMTSGESDPPFTLQDVVADDHEDPTLVCIHLNHGKADTVRHGVDIYLG